MLSHYDLTMKKNIPFVFASLIVLANACSESSDPATVQPGPYRAVLQTPGGELPFGLDIQPTASKPGMYTVFALNGPERLPLDSARVEGDTLRISAGLFESELVAKIDGNMLRGQWRRHRTPDEVVTLPFEATAGYDYRFAKEDKPAGGNLTGTWAANFNDTTGRVDTVNAVGIFKQTGNQISGTFLTPTGDYRYLAGNVVGDSLLLSCFDGTHVFLFKSKHDAKANTLTGGFWAGASYYEPWSARLDPNAKLPDPASLTYLKPGSKTLNIAFPEPNGNVVSLSAPRFNGKVTVVQILGTWCPNCMDETNFLSPWYKKNRSRGVEVLGLAFERSADQAVSGPKIERMKRRFNIDYPVLLAGSSDKAEASKALPDLNAVVAFPTTIVIDKKGQVRNIHTGFSGPGTGKFYDQYVSEFNRLIDKLVAEK